MEGWLHDALDAAQPPPPSRAFRERERERFLVNASSSTEAPSAQPSPRRSSRSAPRRRRSQDREQPRRRPRLLVWALGAGLAAAAALALYFGYPSERARIELVESTLADVHADGSVRASRAELERFLLAASTFETRDAAARLRVDDVVLMEFAANSRAAITHWSDGPQGEYVLRLEAGSVRVLTSRDFAPRRLRVSAPDAEIAIVGTEFGVDVLEGMGTCVCCTEGVIEVTPRGSADADRIEAGGMSFCFASGDEPMLGDVKADHAADVTRLRPLR